MAAKVLVVAEHDGEKLNASTPKCVTCARAIADAEIVIAVCAADSSVVAQQAAQLAGVSHVVTVDNPANEHALAAVLAQPWVDIVLSGAATSAMLQENLAAGDVAINGALSDRLASLAEDPEEYWATRSRLPWN